MSSSNTNPPPQPPSKPPQPAPKSPFEGTGPNKPGFKNILKGTKAWQAAGKSQLGGLDRFERSKLFDKYMSPSMGSNISEDDLKKIDKKIAKELRSVPQTSNEHRELRKTREFLHRIQKMK